MELKIGETYNPETINGASGIQKVATVPAGQDYTLLEIDRVAILKNSKDVFPLTTSNIAELLGEKAGTSEGITAMLESRHGIRVGLGAYDPASKAHIFRCDKRQIVVAVETDEGYRVVLTQEATNYELR